MLKKPENENYCATVVAIRNILPLENCDNVVHANIFGNLIIVGKDTKTGDVGLYFPPETKLSSDFLFNNNLFRHNNLNKDMSKKGYFEDNGRVKCVKFRGNKSMGIFLPLSSLDYTNHRENLDNKVGESFDEISGQKICEKYIVKVHKGGLGGKKAKKAIKKSRLVDNQFRFHTDTEHLGKNIWKVKPDDIIQISTKLHGTSVIISRVLCKKKLNIFLSILRKLGLPIIDTEYYNLVSSRKVIKNDDMSTNNPAHFYDEDVWASQAKKVEDTLLDGMTYYGEIVGFTSTGSAIQPGWDYGCETGENQLYIYRITYTSPSGHVFEMSSQQMQEWCTINQLNPVPELYYGKAGELFDLDTFDIRDWQDKFLTALTDTYHGKDSTMCKNKVPEEGIVLRREISRIDAYKHKSFEFLERESKSLDKGETNLEDNQ